MSYRFHHVHIICKDLEKMVRFFTEALGAKLIDRRKFGTADGACLDLNGTTVNLRVAREDENMVGDASQSTYGYDHIGLEVEDIESAFKDLTARGFSFLMPPTDIPDLKIAFFKGPEDITIDRAGFVFVVDRGAYIVDGTGTVVADTTQPLPGFYRFSSTGTQLQTVLSPTLFKMPKGIAVLPNETLQVVYVADTGNDRILMFRLSTQF